MMKFIFSLLLGVVVFPLISEGFWLVSGLLVLLMVFLMKKNLYYLDNLVYNLDFMVDMVSFSLVFLSLWIMILMYYSSEGLFFSLNSFKYYSICLIFLMFFLWLSFTSMNLLSFYFFFEASLIPTLLIILGWGYQPERLQAGIYFLFYTLFASLPLLLALVYFLIDSGSLDFYLVSSFSNVSLVLFLMLGLAFLVKMPMFYTHLWLPSAHVEAPVAGSMVLAGVLLKLGGYGFFRVLGLGAVSFLNYGVYLIGLSIFGMFYVGLMCCRLNDLKALVAYSSVAHMALVICGIFSFYYWGATGAFAMMIAHGVASSGLFCLVNMYYERLGSRSLFLISGLILLFPLFSLFSFLLCAANMAAPPTLNLFSEIFLMVSILKISKVMLLVFPVASYLGAVFTLFMFSFSQHGKLNFGLYSYFKSNLREFNLLFLHSMPVNTLILKSDYFLFIF